MRLSLTITNYSWPTGPDGLAGRLREVVEAADATGIDTVWINDHLLQAEPGTSRDEPMLESYAALGYLASASSRVRLGTMVAGVTFRPAALLVKAVTTIDVLSGGRAWLGIGAGYQEDEARAMDLPLPPTGERFDQLEDTVRLARHMWAGRTDPFEGRRMRLDGPIGRPAPVTTGTPGRPGPPILIGGMGEKRTLRLVAEHADACNLFDIPDGGATVRHKLKVLGEHCAAVARPAEDVEKTISVRFDPGQPAEAFAEHCAELAELGIDHAVALTIGPWTPPVVERYAATADRLTDR